MSRAGSVSWRARRLLAMTPSEVVVRMARASRARARRPASPAPQDEVAVLAAVLSPDREDLADGVRLAAELDSGRCRIFGGAADPARLALALRAVGSPPEDTLGAADRIVDGKLPAFGWTEIEVGRPTNWNRDPVSGRDWPLLYWADIDFRAHPELGDPRYAWEVNRHHHLLTLARASLLGARRDLAVQAWREMRSWIDASPPYFGINWTSPLEMAIRLVSWASVVDVIGSEGSSPGDAERVMTSVALQARHLSDNLSVYASSRNNHLIGEAVGLLVVGFKFPFLRGAAVWRRVGAAVALREIARQVTREGVNREQTFHYGTFVLEFALLASACLGESGDTCIPALRERSLSMGGFIDAVGGPPGVPPAVGDEDGGRAMQLSEAGPERQAMRAAASASAAYGETLPGGAIPEDLGPALWLFGPERVEPLLRDLTSGGSTSGSAARRRRSTGGAGAFVQGGYFVQGSDGDHAVIDCGPLGYLSIAAHGHADCLALSLMHDGEWFMVDPGTFCYHRDAVWRDHFRSTRAHNAVTIDGASQSEMLGPFMWGRKARALPLWWSVDPDIQFFEGRHDGYARTAGVVHTRSVAFGPEGYWLVVDRLDGEGEHDLRATFQFAEGFHRSGGAECVMMGREFGVSLRSWLPEGITERMAEGETEPPDGWTSRGFGHRTPAPAILYEGRCPLPAVMVFGIVPEAQHREVVLECERRQDDGIVEVVARHSTGADRLLLGGGTASDGARFDGRLGLVTERGRETGFLGMDVACWMCDGEEVPRRSALNLIRRP